MQHTGGHLSNEVTSCAKCGSVHESIFCVLNIHEKETLSENKSFVLYKKGQMVFYEGNYPQGLYCIYSGKVKIHKHGYDGKEQILRFAKKGNVIGYRALLSDEKYHVSATAIEDSLICYFPRNVYQEMIAGNPALSMQIIRLLTTDLRSAEEKTVNMVQKQVRERIAEALLMLKDFFGTEDDGATIATVLTRESIGSIAGTTTETAIRILSDFHKKNVVELVGKKIKVANQKELVKIANLGD
ncbi:MAG: Crp/Fnr family transcriptional regulator [Chlorobi bacterium]|nr:MAG: Crp/Fnr family transcriptional regulator [Chlorobi bacterium OLB6]MBE2265996.1 Crp/Fnr family transcriptional regulator [Flavobacteriales bacterium]MBL1161438.1 Crp/Fnr family transcriptional regulator [Chlorobiota bacterium]MBW7854005.1 Crp/Fnr family transcriptional regulator [Candidatus Kapabacteria bacterium]MCC6331890.1 Crp/Fnr family transcriptional regulator [Ignavibacteria bacterium]